MTATHDKKKRVDGLDVLMSWRGWEDYESEISGFHGRSSESLGENFEKKNILRRNHGRFFLNHAMFPIHWALFQDISFNSLARFNQCLLKVLKVNIPKHPHFAY